MKYQISGKKEEYTLEDKDFLLITAIDNLAIQIKMLRLAYGR